MRFCLLLCCAAGLLGLPGAVRAWPAVRIEARAAAAAHAEASVGVLRCWPPGADPTNATIRVTTPDGRSVPHRVVWWSAGDPLDLRFECAAGVDAVLIDIRPGPARQNPEDTAAQWQDRGGIVLETRRRVSDAVESWQAVQAHWTAAGPPLGRSEVAQIHDGIHRHGPTADFLSRYEGWFTAPRDGRYAFATISDDASFLLVNGTLVAEWPGWHGTDGGRRGQYHGWIPLNAGRHRIEYVNVQNAYGFSVTAAWKPPGAETFAIMPAEAFVPTVRFAVHRVTVPDAAASPAAFRWHTARHVLSARDALIGMQFAAEASAIPSPTEAHWRWSFADGTVREGTNVTHVFLGAGATPVTLDIFHAGERRTTLTQTVNVRPDWTQRAEFDDAHYRKLLAEMPDKHLATLRPEVHARWVAWAWDLDDRPLLTRLGEVGLPRLRQFGAEAAEGLYLLGLHFQRPPRGRIADAKAVWTRLLALEAVDDATRGRTALHLGGLRLHAKGDTDGAEAALAEAARRLPEGAERRLLEIYHGDLRILQDRIAEGRAAYLRAGTVVAADDVHYEVRRAERLERARRFLAAGEHDAAEALLRELEWERPMERLALDTGLLLARVQQARGERPFAVWTVRRLRRVAAGDPRHAELLGLAAQILRDAGEAAQAADVVAELRARFPYSAEAALYAGSGL